MLDCQTLSLPLPTELSEFLLSLKESFHSRVFIHELTFSVLEMKINRLPESDGRF